MIKIIIKASKVSKRNMIKSLNIVKNFRENVKNYVDWSREEHLRNGFSIEFFFVV